ncbi:hypothetical protein CCMA1212_006069 [Trichoderma ghanense]|uniref:Uncharacterized protein n=1 Tax=Trichoderma ghanense TaxID=65468 RepID=A0ABY2H425_9HYPO
MADNGSRPRDEMVLRLGQPDTAAGFELKEPHYPERLHAVLSQCQTEDEVDRELLDDYEIHRRSADMNLNQYLDTLQLVHAEERSKYIHEISTSPSKGTYGESPPPLSRERERERNANNVTVVAVEMRDLCSDMTREQWRLKILRDSLSRDLLAMQETLEVLSARKPREAKEACSRWGLLMPRFWFCVGLLNPILWAMSLYKGVYGLLMYGDAACSFKMGRWPRFRRVEKYLKRVNELYRLLHKGQLGEWNRKDLTECAFDW